MEQEALCRHNRNRQDGFALDTSHGCRSDITYKSSQNRKFLVIKNWETGNLKCRKIILRGIPKWEFPNPGYRFPNPKYNKQISLFIILKSR